MSSFLSLNLQDFGLNQDITDTITATTPFCICCLDRNVVFIKLLNCKHASYLHSFMTPDIKFSSHLVCCHCHTALKKIDLFRRQVEENLKTLNTQSQSIHSAQTTNHRLKTFNKTEIVCLDIVDDVDIIKKEFPDISEPIVTIHEGPSPNDRSEPDDSSDDEIQLKKLKKTFKQVDSKIKTAKKKVKKVVKKKKVTKAVGKVKVEAPSPDVEPEEPFNPRSRKQPMYKRFKGKIKMVELTEDQMQAERERDATNENYQKFPYKCESCIVGFDHEPNYKDHLENRHTPHNGGEACNICKSVLAFGSSFRKHVKNHYTRYECEECSKRYMTLYSVMQHYNTTHGSVGITYKCQHCEYTTDLISAFAYHRNKHRKDLQCVECGKLCSSTANLKTHLFAVHKKSNRVYTCTVCDKGYNTKSGLEHHMSTSHSNEVCSNAYCSECNIQFNSMRCYSAHLRLSSKHVAQNDKRYSCTECGAKFITSNSMKRHVEWVHLKIFKHQCAKCAETFRTRTILKRHVDVVHEKILPPRKHICQYCGKGFTTSQVLRNHIRTHTGERPLSCDLCAATFAHNGALYTHKKLIHKVPKIRG